MRTPKDFYDFQHRAIAHCLQHPKSMLWLEMASGKTAITLSVAAHLLREMLVYRVLVIAPRRVAELVWRQEARKWSHLQWLNISLLRGNTANRVRELHRRDVHIHVINYEALPWLVRQVNADFFCRGQYAPWNMVIYDEVDRFKNAAGVRFSFFEAMRPSFEYRIGMTGTPGDNGYIDLHGQYLSVDDGTRLYQNVGDFRSKWCSERFNGVRSSFEVKAAAKREIEARVADITFSLSAEDYLKLPDYQYLDIWVDLPPKVQTSYDTLEREFFAAMDRHEEDPLDGEWELSVKSAAGARAKCRQVANGAVLTDTGPVLVHDAKLEALDQIIHEANGKPVLVSYVFRQDMARILDRYRAQGYRCEYIGPGTKDAEGIVEAWKRGELDLLTSHPGSIGHGIDGLQEAGNTIVWFGPTDNLRLYRQFNARLRRLGQTAPNVRVYRIVARNTVDEAILDLMEMKEAGAEELRRAVEAYRMRRQNLDTPRGSACGSAGGAITPAAGARF